MWIDPTTNSYIILLTNSVHPRGKGNAVGLRVKVATEIAAALPLTADEKDALRWKSITGYNEALSAERRMSARNGAVKNGIDVLEQHGFDVLKAAEGKKAEALSGLRSAADAEDILGKNPVSPGALVPVREQLGDLLLELQRPKDALAATGKRLPPARIPATP